ncbi:MAG: class I SAM-dependent methyltransferase [Bacteroidota bacterium]
MTQRAYVPALSLKWLTPLYDMLIERPMSALKMRGDLLALAGDLTGRRVLDVGSGTGSLALLAKKAYPGSTVVGLDGDPQILEIARSKARQQGLDVRFDQGMSFELPYADASFDIVFTSMMLHHLDREAKQKTIAEIFRVLRPGGRLCGMDFGEWRGPLGRLLRPFARRLERAAENLDGLLPGMFRRAGFRDFSEIRRYVLGVSLFQASRAD